jgi:ribose transport system permease protein
MSLTDVASPLDPPPAIRDSAPPNWRSALGRVLAHTNATILLILLGITGTFALLDPSSFLTVDNVRNIATDVSILLVLAVGSTFVTVTAGIDLSVGAVLVFAGVIAVKVMDAVGGGSTGAIVLGLISALVVGTGWGVVNGLLIARARLSPLIVTLGTLGMAFGLAQVITTGIDLNPPDRLGELGVERLFGQVPIVVLVAVVVTLVGGVALAKTSFGRYTYAVGSNFEAARRSGIAVDRHLVKVYGVAGFLSGLAGFLALARFSSTTIAGHANDNLQVIAGVVIGGTSLFGGIGTMLGTAVGILIPGVLQNGFVVIGTQPFWQEVAVGAVLIVAVYLDQVRRSRRFIGRS